VQQVDGFRAHSKSEMQSADPETPCLPRLVHLQDQDHVLHQDTGVVRWLVVVVRWLV
jgi:hypothetical protein